MSNDGRKMSPTNSESKKLKSKTSKKSTGLEIDMVAWKEPDKANPIDEFCYAEASSDDEFAQKHFILPSDDEGGKKRKKNKGRKRSDDAPSTTDSSDDDDEKKVEYRIEHILGRKCMSPKEWISVTEAMTTLEITRGSVWQQPDDEYFDPSPARLEKFLIKWTHASYLHLSWETEKDLVEMVGTSAKQQIKKFLIREAEGREIFEDLTQGEYFPASFLQVERILDVDDKDIRINKVNWRKAVLPLPPLLPAAVAVESGEKDNAKPIEREVMQEDLACDEVHVDEAVMDVVDDDDEQPSRSKTSGRLIKKNRIQIDDDDDDEEAMAIDSNTEEETTTQVQVSSEDVMEEVSEEANNKLRPRKSKLLHGDNCWVTIKWEGLSYSELSFETLNDVIKADIDYELPLRAFYRREQSEPKVNETVRDLKIDHSIVGTTAIAPIFPAGELRDYQWEGVRWMLFNLMQGRNSILADEMGLGKTIQSAALLQMIKNHSINDSCGPFLIVAPLSLIVNWQREIRAWTDLDAIMYYGSQDDRELIRSYEFFFLDKKKKGSKVEVVITTPETCVATDTSSGRVRRALSKIHWDMIIVDEAHKLKNYESKLSSTLREEYKFQNCLLLTGTPLQNNTDELWTLLNFVGPSDFGSRDKFMEQFGDLKSSTQLEDLHRRIKPYLLRREKENVEKTVPPKEEIVVEVELTIPQKQYYRAIYEQKTGFLYKQGLKDGPNLTNLAMELRKCCNHPYLIKGAPAALASHFKDDSNMDILIKSSGKMTLLAKLLPKLQGDGHRVLIFSQFRMMLDILEDYIQSVGFTYERVDGSIVGKKRQAAIDRYTNNQGIFIMLLSTKAGGVGINLTAADTVIIYDSDWNPQNDIQAQARAHRIGQTRTVKVYRLLTRKSYEMVMFRAASIKLGLDYAIMHNLGQQGATLPEGIAIATTEKGRKSAKKKKQQGEAEALAGVTMERAETASALSKRELENLLKHGAYDIFSEEKDGRSEKESQAFVEASIEQILERSSIFMHKQNDDKVECLKSSSFSKASFISAGSDTATADEVAIDDPDFWSKVVGLSVEDQAISEGAKRKCRQLIESYKEPTASIRSIYGNNGRDAYVTDSDNESVDSQGRSRKRRRGDPPSLGPGDFTSDNMADILSSLSSFGFGHVEDIRNATKLWWIDDDIISACNYNVVNCLLNFGIVIEKPKTSAATAIESTASASAMEVDDVAVPISTAAATAPSKASPMIHDRQLIIQSMKKYRMSAMTAVLFVRCHEKNELSELNQLQAQFLADLTAAATDADAQTLRTLFEQSLMQQSGIENIQSLQALFEHVVEYLLEHFFATNIGSGLDEEDPAKLQKKVISSKPKLQQIEDLFESYMIVQSMKTAAAAVKGPIDAMEVDGEETKTADEGAEKKAHESNTQQEARLALFQIRLEPRLFASLAVEGVVWKIEHDAVLLDAVSVYGNPDGKRRMAKILEHFTAAMPGISGAMMEEKFTSKLLTSRLKSLVKALRCAQDDLAVLDKAAAAAKATEKQTRKKNMALVLSSIQRKGYPRSAYDHLRDMLKSTLPESESYRLNFLITWEDMLKESGVKGMSEEDLQPVVHAALACAPPADKNSEALCPSDQLEEVTAKQIDTALEKVNVIHQIRVLLAMHAEKELHELVRANCKMAGADVPSFRRDLTLPVWWTLQHDVQLLRLCLEVGYGQWKKIVGDERIANAPADFEMPPKINGVDWTITLTAKNAEKRVAGLLRGLPTMRSLSLPASTSPQRKGMEKSMTAGAGGNRTLSSSWFATAAAAAPATVPKETVTVVDAINNQSASPSAALAVFASMPLAVSAPIPVVTIDEVVQPPKPASKKSPAQEKPNAAPMSTAMKIDLVNEDDENAKPKEVVAASATPSTKKQGKAPKTEALIQEKKSKKPEKAAKEPAPPTKTLFSFFAKNA